MSATTDKNAAAGDLDLRANRANFLNMSSDADADASVGIDAIAQHDAICSVLSHTSLASTLSAARVSREWHAAVWNHHLGGLHALDLRKHSGSLTNERLLLILKACPRLKELNLFGCRQLTDESVRAVASLCPELVSLNVGCIPNVSADCMGAAADALSTTLVDLELSGCTGISEYDLIQRFARFLDLDEDESGLSKCQG